MIVLDFARSQQSAKHNQRKREKGGPQNLAKGAFRLACAMLGPLSYETVHTMELGYMLIWRSEYGAGIEIPRGGCRDECSASPSGPYLNSPYIVIAREDVHYLIIINYVYI